MFDKLHGNGFAMYDTSAHMYSKMIEAPSYPMLPPARMLKDMAPTLEIAQAYQAIFDYFNEALFEPIFGEPLPRCVLNLSRKRNATAFFAPSSWVDPISNEHLDEISLVPEWTGRDPRDVLSSLVHEMAHQRDHLYGTAGKNGYHSQTWAKLMARLGLPEYVRSKSRIKVSHTIDPNGAYAVAYQKMPRELTLPFQTTNPMHLVSGVPKTEAHGGRAKYICPGCGDNVRGKGGMKLMCLDCNEELFQGAY